MLLFITIFFATVIAVGVFAVIGFSVYLKRRTKSLKSDNQRQFEEPPVFRSLFEPTREEILALEREEKEQSEVTEREKARRVLTEKAEQMREFQKIWQNLPDRKNTVELFRLAAESESGKVFSEMAENVIKVFRDGRIEDLTIENLIQLLESHFWLLPDKERTSGVSFWLKQEIASLRSQSAGKN